jgi:3-oxoacyl-[acyl-carrier protein] reductase
MDLKDAIVLVTGGTSGIGYETAKQLVAAGATVAICGRDEIRTAIAAQEIGATPIQCNVSNEAEVRRMISTMIDVFGGFNVVINNAAYGHFSALTDLETSDFDDIIATNIKGAMLVGRESARHFTKNNYGNIISTAGNSGFANGTAYCASKFALKGMTECWRAELRKHNIRVMLVNPSEVQTNFLPNSGLPARPQNDTKLESADIAHTIIALLSMHDRGFVTETTVFATNPV